MNNEKNLQDSEKALHLGIVSESTVKCDCGADGVLGTCPYAEEINGSTVECTCCDSCRHECAMDI